MSYIDEFIEKRKAEFDRQIALAEKHRVLEPFMTNLIMMWNAADKFIDYEDQSPVATNCTVAFDYTSIESCCVDFHLAKNEGLKDRRVESVLTYVLHHPDFTFRSQHEYSAMSWIGWKFTHTNGAILMLRFWTGKSKVCRYVPTGKFTEELKLVCEDAA
jgi:hypothetical protein